MRKELRLWSLFSFTFYAQCFLDAAVGAMNTLKAVSIATSAIDRYLVLLLLLLLLVVVVLLLFFLLFFWGGCWGRRVGVGWREDYPA